MSEVHPGEPVDVVGPLRAGECQVWWATPDDARPWHPDLLDAVERRRADRYVRGEDRVRFTLGVAMTRVMLGAMLGDSPERVPLRRDCAWCGEPHGPPYVAAGPHVSVAHSGDRVAVAFAADGPVGVDVETLSRDGHREVARHVLAPEEYAILESTPPGQRAEAFVTYWTRKEAVVKATRDGLRMPLTRLVVSPPGDHPRVLAWHDRPDTADRVTLRDLRPGSGHLASLALIGRHDVTVRELSATAVLTG